MKTNLDFEALYRSGVGFDRALHILRKAHRSQSAEPWPPYDIVRLGGDYYHVEIAVAGFGTENLDVIQDGNVLHVIGAKTADTVCEYLHHGIVDRSFKRQFELADYVQVQGASLGEGLLRISLKRDIPDTMKPRKIAIGASKNEPMTLATHL